MATDTHHVDLHLLVWLVRERASRYTIPRDFELRPQYIITNIYIYIYSACQRSINRRPECQGVTHTKFRRWNVEHTFPHRRQGAHGTPHLTSHSSSPSLHLSYRRLHTPTQDSIKMRFFAILATLCAASVGTASGTMKAMTYHQCYAYGCTWYDTLQPSRSILSCFIHS